MREIRTRVYLIIGWLSVGLAVVGSLLPVMPTVPFLLVAFWAFSQSSPRLSRRILRNPHFGPILRDWLRYQAIPRPAKYLATATMATGCLLSWMLRVPNWALALQVTVCLLVAAFILSRPDRPDLP